jgi:hypothetical protein
MTPVIEKQIADIKEILKDNPADANAYVLLNTMVEMLNPIKEKMFMSTNELDIMVAKQINLINRIALDIVDFLDVKKANLK